MGRAAAGVDVRGWPWGAVRGREGEGAEDLRRERGMSSSGRCACIAVCGALATY